MAGPKIPAEYAKVAKKLTSEVADAVDNINWSEELTNLSKGLSGNLEQRSADLGAEGMQTVKAAGVFDMTTAGKTPDIKEQSEYEVAIDGFLGKTSGVPKSVEGSGSMKRLNPVFDPKINMVQPPVYDKNSGVLSEQSGYTPAHLFPNSANITNDPSGRSIPTMRAQEANRAQNNTDEANFDGALGEFMTPKARMSGAQFREHIPAVAGGIVGAGVLLSSQNAEAKPVETPYQKLEKQRATKPTPIDLMLKKSDEPKQTSMFEDFVNDSHMQLLEFVRVQKERIPMVIENTMQQFELEKNIITSRAATAAANWDKLHPDTPMTEIDKELMLHTLGASAEDVTPLMRGVENVMMANTEVKQFKQDVLDPMRHALGKALRQGIEPGQNSANTTLRQVAPSLAVLSETLVYPLVGASGWNVKPGTFGIFNTDEEMAKGLAELDPVAQKLIADKSTFLGTEAGQAMLVMASAYSELPIWLIGGISAKGMAAAGALTEAVRDEGDITTGAVAGVVGGKVVQKVIGSKPVQAVINLTIKGAKGAARIAATEVDQALIRNAPQDMAAEAFARIVKRTPKRVFEPVALMPKTSVAKLANDAAAKADTLITTRFRTGELEPQIIVLDLGEDGIPKTYGVHNNKVGEIVASGPTDKTVITTRRAGQGWPENLKVRDLYSALTETETMVTREGAFQDWHDNLIPPENPELVFAWTQKDEEGGMLKVYRAASDKLNGQLLRSRSLVKVQYEGPNGEDKVGLGFLNASGAVIAPDPSEGIPGAIPRDLVFTQTRMEGAESVTPPLPENWASEVNVITDDDTLHAISRAIKNGNDLRLQTDSELTRNNMHPNGVPIEAPPAIFDNLPDNIPPEGAGIAPEVAEAGTVDYSPSAIKNKANAASQVNMALIPGLPYVDDIAKAVAKLRENVKVSKHLTEAGKFADKWLYPATSYGEVFKIDAAIQQFSHRHFKRYITDVEKQLAENFGTAATNDPAARIKFSNDVRDFITGAQRATPPSLAPHVQAKVNAFTNERNADYALIESLGGIVPEKADLSRNVDLERMYALDYLTPAEWAARLKKEHPYISDQRLGLISLTKNTNEGKAARLIDPELFGKQKIERDMSMDYFMRKQQITQLTVMQELASNPQAASPGRNEVLGHTQKVDFDGAGLLKGKWVDPDTHNAIFTFPKEQQVVTNQFLAMLKYNKTVLNPGTWLMNIMGDVWGTMMSNIVTPIDMMWKMPKAMFTMKNDLAKYNSDLTRGFSPQSDRVHETLKFGLLGAEYEINKSRINDVLDGLLTSKAKTWGEKLTSIAHKVRDNSTGALGNAYSTIDMATKYGLYVSGLERWGIDLKTNMMPDTPEARLMMGKLLGHGVVANMTALQATEAGKRAIVRRIHLTLPMVDRASPVTTGLSRFSGVTNPWLRTSLELVRVNSQLPYRAFTEPGFALTMAKTGGFLAGIYALNKKLRMDEGISDEKIANAVAIAPDNQKKYMGSPLATFYRAADGGITFIDASKGLVEALQWFKGNEPDGMGKRVAVNILDTVFKGGVAANEYEAVMAKVGLKNPEQVYNTPLWKQDDWQRGGIDMMTRLGPQVINNSWNLYSREKLPPRMVGGNPEVKRSMDIETMRAFGLPVESWGSKEQKQSKLSQISMERSGLIKQLKSMEKQTEGSSTGAWQEPLNKADARSKMEQGIRLLDDKERALMKVKPIDLRKAKSAPKRKP